MRDRSRFPNWIIWVLGAGFGVAALLSAYLIFNVVRQATSSFSTTGGLPTFSLLGGGEPSTLEDGGPSLPTRVALEEEVQAWNGSDRVTILIMGLDFRDWLESDGPPRTDSMMLVTIDPIAMTAGMLSVPRDLWTEIPGFEHNRINTAYFLGESYNLPGGGPGLAMDTVENLLGVPIQYYAVIEFQAFERVVDEIGGIDLLVEEDIKISPIGETSYWLDGGEGHHLNGAETLAYARARKTEGGDFDRAQRQQRVARAIRDKITDLNMMPTLLAKAPAIYSEIAAGINTNMTLDEMIRLGLLALQLQRRDIHGGIIGPPDMVTFQLLPDGAEVLKPIPDQIRVLRDEIFTSYGAIGPSIPTDDPLQAAIAENAKVAVLNGAGIEGLAGNTTIFLAERGINVARTDNANRLDYTKTILIDYTGNPYTAQYLLELMGLSQSQILSQADPTSDVDLAVVLGSDWFVP